jgi:hypothetical protein
MEIKKVKTTNSIHINYNKLLLIQNKIISWKAMVYFGSIFHSN